MKINLAALWRAASPIVVPIVVGAITAKVQQTGYKVVEKAKRGR